MCIKMSDVRLSNASPTLERVDARQPDNLRPPVRRSLFGAPDREEVQRYFAASVREDVQAFRERYNFDPEEDRPLSPGNFEWQEASDPPEFFLRPPHGSQRPRGDADSPAEGSPQQRQPSRRESDGARKRRSGALGPCSSECPTKRSHSDEDDDDEEQPGCAGSQAVAVAAAEERASGPESGAEVQ